MTDKARLRATVSYTVEYDADPEDYATADTPHPTPEQMAAVEADCIKDGEFDVWDHPDSKCTWKVEVVK